MKLDTVREDKAILNVTTRLTETFAQIHDPEDVEVAVQAAHRHFDGDPVREYVPILVERIVRKDLADQPDPTVNPAPDPEAEEAAAGAESDASRLAPLTSPLRRSPIDSGAGAACSSGNTASLCTAQPFHPFGCG